MSNGTSAAGFQTVSHTLNERTVRPALRANGLGLAIGILSGVAFLATRAIVYTVAVLFAAIVCIGGVSLFVVQALGHRAFGARPDLAVQGSYVDKDVIVGGSHG
jgi:predicted small integral membrane protein